MIIILELMATIAVSSAITTYITLKLVEWWECRK